MEFPVHGNVVFEVSYFSANRANSYILQIGEKKLLFKFVIDALLQHNVYLNQSPHKMIIGYPNPDAYIGLCDHRFSQISFIPVREMSRFLLLHVISLLILNCKVQ